MQLYAMWEGQNGGGLVMVIYQCSEVSVLVFDLLSASVRLC